MNDAVGVAFLRFSGSLHFAFCLIDSTSFEASMPWTILYSARPLIALGAFLQLFSARRENDESEIDVYSTTFSDFVELDVDN